MITWKGLLFAFLIVLLTIITRIVQTWPRHPDGRLYSMEEASEEQKRQNKKDSPQSRLEEDLAWKTGGFTILFVFSLIAVLGSQALK